MTTFDKVNPESFVKTSAQQPAHGRGAWVKEGIDFSWRYEMSENPALRIGTRAEVSLAHWAIAAGSYAIQQRLVALGFMKAIGAREKGIYGQRTKDGVKAFQAKNTDPSTGTKLTTDGTVGRSDARALWTPLMRTAEQQWSIPDSLLIGEINHESALDPGAVGYYIYYPAFRGVDRSIAQINSLYNPQVTWDQAFDPVYSFKWSAERMKTFHDKFAKSYPKQPEAVLWDAAVCAHNNPSAAEQWARNGYAPQTQASGYVNAVKAARY